MKLTLSNLVNNLLQVCQIINLDFLIIDPECEFQLFLLHDRIPDLVHECQIPFCEFLGREFGLGLGLELEDQFLDAREFLRLRGVQVFQHLHYQLLTFVKLFVRLAANYGEMG
jgi:hypothetical protein